MTRAAFAELSLDQKNTYLQDVARLLAAADATIDAEHTQQFHALLSGAPKKRTLN